MSLDSDLVALFGEIAPALGATLKVEPQYKRAGMLQFGNGSVLFFRNNHLNINLAGNARMAADKSFASFFLAGMGFRVLPEVTVSLYDIDRGAIEPQKHAQVIQFAAQNEWRAIVKPNALSQGRGVSVTRNQQDLFGAIAKTLAINPVCIVQQYCAMPEYRLVVLENSLLQAYRRRPMTVTGDGSSSIAELVERKIETLSEFRHEEPPPDLLSSVERTLTSQGKNFIDIAVRGDEIVVADTANLSAGGEAIDVAEILHPKWIALAHELASKFGLLLCGVDIFIDDISDGDSDYRVIELNSAPGLDDYLLQGEAQRKRVSELYRRVLQTAAATLPSATSHVRG